MPLSASWTISLCSAWSAAWLALVVGRIDSAQEPAVEAQADHPPQLGTIAVEKRSQRRLVAGQGTLDENLVFVARQIDHCSAP